MEILSPLVAAQAQRASNILNNQEGPAIDRAILQSADLDVEGAVGDSILIGPDGSELPLRQRSSDSQLSMNNSTSGELPSGRFFINRLDP